VKGHHQNAGHEIDQIGAGRCVYWPPRTFGSDHQVQKLQLHHDDPLTSVNNCLQKVIVNMVFAVELRGELSER
jgi:hypothetical protein